ncbi:MAG: hypothetical protein K0R54_2412 [Clostridiaceae bacterium]|jgi:hypothetical protein|nr:hypothetical protein [Clostridiaceae bacterium]
MASTNENMFLWEQQINERNKSGMTVKEWCEKNGITKYKYNYWNYKILMRKENPVEEMESTFILGSAFFSLSTFSI